MDLARQSASPTSRKCARQVGAIVGPTCCSCRWPPPGRCTPSTLRARSPASNGSTPSPGRRAAAHQRGLWRDARRRASPMLVMNSRASIRPSTLSTRQPARRLWTKPVGAYSYSMTIGTPAVLKDRIIVSGRPVRDRRRWRRQGAVLHQPWLCVVARSQDRRSAMAL